ncbi:hypothetical protein BGX38DRAFT_833090 [Terfezia claveryi]|nr:hypothetical protein BGX38DRAFT_833090 [Terfezia claveryi]
MRLYIPRTALAGAATTTSSSQLRQLASSTTSRTSLLPSHLYRRFLALQLSPLQQLHKRVSPPLRCRCHVEGMGISRGGGWGWIQERRIAATAVVGVKTVKKTSYPPRPKVKEEEIEEKFLKGSGPGGQKTYSDAAIIHPYSTPIVFLIPPLPLLNITNPPHPKSTKPTPPSNSATSPPAS